MESSSFGRSSFSPHLPSLPPLQLFAFLTVGKFSVLLMVHDAMWTRRRTLPVRVHAKTSANMSANPFPTSRPIVHPMGNCCSCAATVPYRPQETEMTRHIPVLSQPSATKPPGPMSPSFRTHGQPSPSPEMIHYSGMSSQDSNVESRVESSPQPPPPSPQNPRIITQSLTMSYPSRISLTSTVMQVLTDQPGFRIPVVGKRGSGKSLLINTTFRVVMSATSTRVSADINFTFRLDDNRHLIVGGEILSTRRVPIVIVFTKSDLAFPQISGSNGGNPQFEDRATSRAYAVILNG